MPKENTWTTYKKDEIKEEYQGPDTVVLMDTEVNEESTVFNTSLENLACIVTSGHTGAIFNGVHYEVFMEENDYLLCDSLDFPTTLEILEEILVRPK